MAAIKPADARNRRVEDPESTVAFDECPFIEGVYHNDYALVVGPGVILDRSQFPESDGDINAYLLRIINEELNKNYKSLTQIKSEGKSPLYRLLAEKLNEIEMKYYLSDISPELRELLGTRLFKFVLTTTYDAYLETLMRSLWGDTLRIVNIEDEFSLREFSRALASKRDVPYCQPTLFYVFGKAEKDKYNPTSFLESDEDAISYIVRWINIGSKEKKEISDFLKKKRFLGIGCKYEDWYFRFFWYIITREFKRSKPHEEFFANRIHDNVVLGPGQQRLRDYLNDNNVCIHDDPWAFMKRIYTLITDTDTTKPAGKLVRDKRLKGRIFLSYKTRPDADATLNLFRKLHSAGTFNIWFDDARLKGGDNYNADIPDAIDNTKIFIPILSPTVAEVTRSYNPDSEDKDKPYFIKEWLRAREVPGIRIIPVAIDGYDLKSQDQQIFESIIRTEEQKKNNVSFSGIDLSQEDGIGKLIESINKQLGIDYE